MFWRKNIAYTRTQIREGLHLQEAFMMVDIVKKLIHKIIRKLLFFRFNYYLIKRISLKLFTSGESQTVTFLQSYFNTTN